MAWREIVFLGVLAVLGMPSLSSTYSVSLTIGATTSALPFEHKITWSHANFDNDRVTSRVYEVLLAEVDFNDKVRR